MEIIFTSVILVSQCPAINPLFYVTICLQDLKIISTSAFSDCSGLTGAVILSETVESIGLNAFDSCSGMSAGLKKDYLY